MTKTETAIVHEMMWSIMLLGAESDLLAAVGSFKTTLDDDEVLSSLKTWNDVTRKERAAEDIAEMQRIISGGKTQ